MEVPTHAEAREERRSSSMSRRMRATRIRVAAWVLKEAATWPGAVGMIGLSFLGSAFVPLALEPFVIVLTTNLPRFWRRFALCFAIGSILGGVATYIVGYLFFTTFGLPIIRFWGEEELWEKVLGLAQTSWWVIPVGVVSIGPGPTKLVTMAAGAANVAFLPFLVVLVTGRLIRFYATAYFARVFGQRMHEWYVSGRKRAVYASVVVLTVALILAYVAARAVLL
jgi:membrane protein YqaA with SNARE-associated domain